MSRSATTKLAYPNSVLLAGDAAETVAALKEDATMMGSGELVRSLHAVGLVDRYVLMIHPITLGSVYDIGSWFAVLALGDMCQVARLFPYGPEGKVVKNRQHLDVRVCPVTSWNSPGRRG